MFRMKMYPENPVLNEGCMTYSLANEGDADQLHRRLSMIYIFGNSCEPQHEETERSILHTSRERCLMLGTYIVESGATVRATAKKFGISKSTVHKDVTEVLKRIDPAMYHRVREILDLNKQERHIRGGEATRRKYSGVKAQEEASEKH